MSLRYIPPKAPVRSHLASSRSLSVTDAQAILASYLERTTSFPLPVKEDPKAKTGPANLWNHTHDAGTTAALRKIELSMRGFTPDKLSGADEFMLVTGLDMEENFAGGSGGNWEGGSSSVNGQKRNAREGSMLDRDEGYSEGNQRTLPTEEPEEEQDEDAEINSDYERMEITRPSMSPMLERRRGAYDGDGDENNSNEEASPDGGGSYDQDYAEQEAEGEDGLVDTVKTERGDEDDGMVLNAPGEEKSGRRVDKEERKRLKRERKKLEKQEKERKKRHKRESES